MSVCYKTDSIIHHFSKKRGVPNKGKSSSTQPKRINSGPFDYEKFCIFCEEECDKEKERKKKRKIVGLTEYLAEKLLAELGEHENSEVEVMRKRIELAPRGTGKKGQGTKYHHKCERAWSSKLSHSRAIGRPSHIKDKFSELFNFMRDSGKEQFLLHSLLEKIGGNIRHSNTLEEALKDEFGDEIAITRLNLMAKRIVTFNSAQSKIYHDYYERNNSNEDDSEQEYNSIIDN